MISSEDQPLNQGGDGDCGNTDIERCKRELEGCQRKIRGYEVLNILYKESLDKCKVQEEQNSKLEEKLKFLESQLKGNIVKEKCDLEDGRDDGDKGDEHVGRNDEELASLGWFDVQRRDALLDHLKILATKYPDFLKFTKSFATESSEPKLGKCTTPRSSSDNSFVKINDDEIYEVKDDEELKLPSSEASPIRESQEENFEESMRKLMAMESLATSVGGTANFPQDVCEVMNRMCQLHDRSQLVQAILENLEKENKELKKHLELKQGENVRTGGTSATKERGDMEIHQRVDELLSCKQALLKLLSNKDQQLADLKLKTGSLKTKLEQSKMAHDKMSACFHEGIKKWQRDHRKLEEQLEKTISERDHDRLEVSSMRSEIKALKKRLEDRKQLQHLNTLGSGRNDSGEVDILKQQVAVYAEDFDNERRDREKAQALVESLQKKLEQLSNSHYSLSKNFTELSEEHRRLVEKYQTKSGFPSVSVGATKTYKMLGPPRGQPPVQATLSPTAPFDDTHRYHTSWQCSVCTFINEGWEDRCQACSLEK